jgi:hypothetical protein
MRLAVPLVCSAFVLLGCSSDSDNAGGASTDAFAAVRAQCVDKINSYRATLGLPAYAAWPEQGTCSDGEATSDAQTGSAHGAFGKCTEMAQNECPGWPGPPETMIDKCLEMMWAEGPGTDFTSHGHYLNMSSTKYSKVACGFFQTADGKWWSVQNFR